MKRLLYLLLFIFTLSLVSCSLLDDFFNKIGSSSTTNTTEDIIVTTNTTEDGYLDPNGYYNTKDDVALYIHLYDRLPLNYITKAEAEEIRWTISSGLMIGGDRFYNREGLLPNKEGRIYYECDVDYSGNTRGPRRIVFSNDGLVYYTDDHYESFTLLYGDE